MKIEVAKHRVNILLTISAHYLVNMFNYNTDEAVSTTIQYYETWKPIHQEDDFYRHLGPFETAIRIHYFIGLGGSEAEYIYWRRDNNYNIPEPIPEDAEPLWQELMNPTNDD